MLVSAHLLEQEAHFSSSFDLPQCKPLFRDRQGKLGAEDRRIIHLTVQSNWKIVTHIKNAGRSNGLAPAVGLRRRLEAKSR